MKRTFVVFAVLFCIAAATIAQAGSLNPPAPPTAGTMKPLDQVEPRTPITSVPYVISSSGSYYLTKNLTATGTAINIGADDVTIDLCGFTLTGPGTGVNYGISTNSHKNIEIRNGVIRNFGYAAIYGGGSSRRIMNLRVLENQRHGIEIYNSNAQCGDVVKDCVVTNNGNSYSGGGYGIYLHSSHCVVSGNVVYGNGNTTSTSGYGISVGANSTVTGNTVHTNYGYGIAATTLCRIEDNTVTDNKYNGVVAGDFCSIKNNTVSFNAVVGILAGNHCTMSGNSVISNGNNGISVNNDCIITGNIVNSNSDGIRADDHVTITDNTVSSNRSPGIYCIGGYIARNTVSLNNTTGAANWGGIVVANHSQIKDNTLEGNSKNNIYVTGFRNSVEGNVMSGSDYGIRFGGTGNVYLNNRASANGVNYNAAGNTDGGGNIPF